MWRFILITFGFLGWSFYELSDGADFTPEFAAIQNEASAMQIASALKTKPPKLPNQKSTLTAGDAAIVVRLPTTPIASTHRSLENRVKVTLASAAPQSGNAQRLAIDTTKARFLTQRDAEEPTADIRTVKKNRVNMRKGPGTRFGVASKLAKGQEVEILANSGNGWLRLRVVETGRIGWMADWLITAAN